MSFVQISSDNQVKLPNELLNMAHIHAGDYLEPVYQNGQIVLNIKPKNNKDTIVKLEKTLDTLPQDTRSEQEIMQDAISDIADYRAGN